MKILPFVALIAILTSAGCVTDATSHLTPLPGEDGINAADAMDANLSPAVAKMEEPLFSKSNTTVVKYGTGEVWARVFIGQTLSPASIEVLSTRLSEKIGADGTRSATYAVNVRLNIDSKPYPLHATATRTAPPVAEPPLRQAVEAAIVDVATQAKAIEKRVHPDFVPQ